MHTKPDDSSVSTLQGKTSHELAKFQPGVVWVADTPWQLSDGVLRPLAMPHIPIAVDRRLLRSVLRKHRTHVAIWTTDWASPRQTEWWWNCCDDPAYAIERVESARGRRSVRKGLSECETRIVPADEFASSAYGILAKAVRSYGGTPPPEADYRSEIKKMAEYPGTELWASYFGSEMAAFATCQIIDGAVTLGSTKSEPELNKHNPNAALFYTICNHYLTRGVKYISNGWRTLWHPTSINDFLMRLGFRRIYARVHVELSPLARAIDATRVARWGQYVRLSNIIGRRWLQLRGLRDLVRIAESFE